MCRSCCEQERAPLNEEGSPVSEVRWARESEIDLWVRVGLGGRAGGAGDAPSLLRS